MGKFKVGDRVVLEKVSEMDSSNGLKVGSKGTIVKIKDDNSYIVQFDDWNKGHDAGLKDYSNDKWFVGHNQLKLEKDDNHYQTRIQPIETMQANMTPEEFQGFCKGNIIKYACRCGRKDEPLKEAEKIVDYAKWLVASLKGEIINPHDDDEEGGE